MTQATAGQEFNKNTYSFKAAASATDVQTFYADQLKSSRLVVLVQRPRRRTGRRDVLYKGQQRSYDHHYVERQGV